MRYFKAFGGKCVVLGLALMAAVTVGWQLGFVPAMATFGAAPLLTVGAAMWLAPGDADGASFEEAWLATRASRKLIWLLGFSVGVIAMMAFVFFVVAPASAP